MRRLATLVFLVSWLGGGRAHAYVRYKTPDQNVGFYWQTTCVPITIYTNGFTELSSDEVAKAVSAAAHTWSPDDVTCADGVTHPYLEIAPSLAVGASSAPSAKYDARNVLIFQNDNWVHQGEALALTTVLAKADGRIVDADIEVNATSSLTWVNLDPGAVGPGHGLAAQDLQNALTHEFGHFIGLDHTCYIPDSVDSTMSKPRPTDDKGALVPDCTDATAEIRATVMFPYTSTEETSQRFLSPDEVRAVCEIYPSKEDPKICTMDSPNDGFGCATAGAGPRGQLVALALAAGALVLRRRRRFGR
jgi:hypothetical protein